MRTTTSDTCPECAVIWGTILLGILVGVAGFLTWLAGLAGLVPSGAGDAGLRVFLLGTLAGPAMACTVLLGVILAEACFGAGAQADLQGFVTRPAGPDAADRAAINEESLIPGDLKIFDEKVDDAAHAGRGAPGLSAGMDPSRPYRLSR